MYNFNNVNNQQDATSFSFINLSISTVAPVGSRGGALYQKLYIELKVLLRMGEFVARNMLG